MIHFPDTHLSQKNFSKIAEAVYRLCGINLLEGKEELIKVRLSKRLRVLGLENFEEYVALVERDEKELAAMIDSLTTNKTSFFREPQHFACLRECVSPELGAPPQRIRIWSAGCSSGEEPYSIAMTLKENHPNLEAGDVRILATDISMKMVARVREAVYDEEALRNLPPCLLKKYFVPARSKTSRSFRVCEAVRALVRVAQLNLMEPWPMRGGFDVIFCRNVMIYFDKATQETLVRRFGELLRPGGYLFVGHSESLTGLSHSFQYVKPAIYMKHNP
jgi:chemotaxis protein methyltransferase CheR